MSEQVFVKKNDAGQITYIGHYREKLPGFEEVQSVDVLRHLLTRIEEIEMRLASQEPHAEGE